MPKKTQKNRPPVKLANCKGKDSYDVSLWRYGKTFTVIYGEEQKAGLDYSNAARAFGLAVLHACACEGLLDGMPEEKE